MLTTYSFTLTVLVIVLLVLLVRSVMQGVKLQDSVKGWSRESNERGLRVDGLTHELHEVKRQLHAAMAYQDIDLKKSEDTNRSLREELRESRKLHREATNKLSDYLLSDITSIKFTANIPTKGWTKTEFKLGVGTCGKEVSTLHWQEKEDRYELRQTCTDGERKEFTYMKSDIAGRIEMAYSAPKE